MFKLTRWFHSINLHLPTRQKIFASRWLKPFARWFNRPYFWQLNQKSAALSVAIGLFCGLMPGPTQMLSALVVAFILRTNLPLALFTTLYSNPLTYLPLYYLAYRLGLWLLQGQTQSLLPALPNSHGMAYWHELWRWLLQFGQPLLIGVPVLGLMLALAGYMCVWYGWSWIRAWLAKLREQ